MMDRGQAIGNVQQWLEEIDLITKRLDHPSPGEVVVFEVVSTTKQDPGKLLLNVSFPSRAPVVLIYCRTAIDQAHVGAWLTCPPETRFQFVLEYRRVCMLEKFLPSVCLTKVPPFWWGVMSETFFDGLTRDRFFHRLRGVAEASTYLQVYFHKTIVGISAIVPAPTPNMAPNPLHVEWSDKPKEESL